MAQPSFSVTVHVYTLFKQEIQRCLKQSTKNYPIMWSTIYILEFPKRSVSSTYSYIYGNIILEIAHFLQLTLIQKKLFGPPQRNISVIHKQQQSYSGLHLPRRSYSAYL